MRRLLAFLSFTLFVTGISFSQAKLPQTPVREVSEEYFGTKITDPYRWLEKTSDPEVASWMKAQNDYTRSVLAGIPGRDKLLERVTALDKASTRVRLAQVWGGKLFYLKTDPGADNSKLYVRDSVNAKERLLIDPEPLTTITSTSQSIIFSRAWMVSWSP